VRTSDVRLGLIVDSVARFRFLLNLDTDG